jgi:DNA-binding HxlR family transcriptional regulator
MKHRSDCPISCLLDHVGDKWSLLIIRDIALYGKQSYKALQQSNEKIATNILAARLETLESSGLISKHADPDDKRKKRYVLTPAGKDLIPVLVEMILWSDQYESAAAAPAELVQRAKQDRASLIRDLQTLS